MTDDLVAAAERITLGGMLLDPAVIDTVTTKVRGDDFADPRHRAVFAAVVSNHAADIPTDPMAVAVALSAVEELHRVGGGGYLHTLVASVPTAANAAYYAGVVAQAAAVRGAAADAARLAQVAETGDADKVRAEQARLVESWSTVRTESASSSWHPIDLADALTGTHVLPTPSVGRRDDGVGLFYPGRIHSLAGESESLKTWVSLIAAMTELTAGNAVAYLDFEDDETGMVGRLLALGADPSLVRTRFCYIRPDDAVTSAGNRTVLAQALGDLRPTLAVIDGVTEAMSLHGLELKDNTDVARFGKLLPRWIADRGPATVALDHVTKDREARGRYAIGGQHKLAGLNGAAFTLENRSPFGVGKTGRSTLFIVKDRPGQLRRHALPASDGLAWLADVVLESPPEHSGRAVFANLTVPNADVGPFRPTVLMARVSEALERAGTPLTKQDIEARVRGKRASDVRSALAVLVDEEYVAVSRGARGAILHTLAKPFGGGHE